MKRKPTNDLPTLMAMEALRGDVRKHAKTAAEEKAER
jgi:hypothetical protein